jgi:hypothetical protein
MSSPSSSNSPAPLSPIQASFVYWLNGLAPVATNIVTPLVVYWNMRHKVQSLLCKYNVQVNEVVRQFISGTIGLLSYFGGGELTRGLLHGVLGVKKSSLDDSTRQVAMITGGVLASFIGFAFVRPYISTELICKFLKHEKGEAASFSSEDVLGILHGARVGDGHSVNSDWISLPKATTLLHEEEAEKIRKVAGVKSNHWLIGRAQRWIDRHLVPNGQPDLAKVARYSTLGLAGYLGLLTLGLWSVNRLFSRAGEQAPVPVRPSVAVQHPALMGGSIASGPSSVPRQFPMRPTGMAPQSFPAFSAQMQRSAMPWSYSGLAQIR